MKKVVTISCKPMQQFQGQMTFLKDELERWRDGNFTVFLIADGKERMEKVQSVLEDYDMEATLAGDAPTAGGVFLIDGDLSAGFELPLHRIAVITDAELFKGKTKTKSRTKKCPTRSALKVTRK